MIYFINPGAVLLEITIHIRKYKINHQIYNLPTLNTKLNWWLKYAFKKEIKSITNIIRIMNTVSFLHFQNYKVDASS